MRNKIAILLVLIFAVGAGVIVYRGRPVMTTQPTGTGTGDTSHPYSLTDIAAHNSTASCWSAVNGGVYDLTTWIDRHPGGSQAIEAMCGIDGSSLYNGQHGTQRRPMAALFLLKIGTLK